jgi:hypothetical protein
MTRPFAALERILERLLERPAARLFRAPLQPVQLQRRLERTMDSGRVFSADRTYVPNRYRVALNPADLVAFEAYRDTLEGELADAIHQRARARGHRLLALPEVILVGSNRVAAGDIHVTAELLDPSQLGSAAGGAAGVADSVIGNNGSSRVAAGRVPSLGSQPAANPQFRSSGTLHPTDGASQGVSPAAPAGSAPAGKAGSPQAAPNGGGSARGSLSATAFFPTAPADAPLAILEVRTLAGPASQYTFRGGAARIGRSLENEIVLVDDRVSRRHGQVTTRHGALVYTDLGSTNGSFVNGTRVTEIALGSGDVVRLGNSTLTIQPHH